MIIFKKIKYKNFLSSGNHWSELSLNESKTTLICGTNGNGKSLVIDALTFSLYGKSYRKINKPQLVNSINEKDCVVEIEFSVGSNEWKVIRGIKPSVFEIYQNSKLLDQFADFTEQQKWFEQNVLKMNFKSFTQVVILGTSTFVPFMELPAAHRREVIEDLLDIRIFFFMTTVVKEKIKKIKDEIKLLELKKENLTDKIQMQKKFIEELENQGNQTISERKNKIIKLISDNESYIKENDILEESVFKYTKEQEYVLNSSDKVKKFGNIKGKISQKISTLSKEHKFFEDNLICPTCTQPISEEFKKIKIKDAQNKITELNKNLDELKKVIEDEEEKERQFLSLSKEISKLTNLISQNHIKISTNQKQVTEIETEIRRIENQLQNQNSEKDKLKNFKETFKKVSQELLENKESIHYYDYTYSILKDSGVKREIIKKYLPLINQKINHYLQIMDLYINFNLDEEFNESIQSPAYEKFSYSSFSEGEKSRINLALIFSWREIARIKNSINCNLIFFDEVFDGSMDESGTDSFLKIIQYLLRDTNVFVISHKTGIEDRFDVVYNVEKIKGFSRITKL